MLVVTIFCLQIKNTLRINGKTIEKENLKHIDDLKMIGDVSIPTFTLKINFLYHVFS